MRWLFPWIRAAKSEPKVEEKVEERTRKLFYPGNHFTLRAFERVGLLVTPEVYTDMLESIWHGHGEKVRVDEDGRILYRIKVNEEFFFVVYEPRSQVLVTLFHKGWMKRDENGKWREVEKFSARAIRNRSFWANQREEK